MRDRSGLTLSMVAMLGSWLSACAPPSSAPDGWLADTREALNEAYGGWIVIEVPEPREWPIEGELLAVDADSVYVLERQGFRAMSWGALTRAQVTGYDSGAKEVAGLAAMGALSSLTHGYLVILTAPLWGALGGSAAKFQAGYALRTYPDKHRIEEFALFARYPGGLPAGLDRASLTLVGPAKERLSPPKEHHSLFGEP